MDINAVKTLSGFYYCLLVSIWIYKKSVLIRSPSDRKRHVAAWLLRAKERQLFSKIVVNDIHWLMELNRQLDPDVLENQLLRIYRSSRLLYLSADIYSEKAIQ